MEPPVIVVLEDNEFAASVIRRTIELAGYRCVETRTESEALECCRLHGSQIGLVIADLILPGCRGTDVVLRVLRHLPDLPVLFVSGTPFDAWPESDRRKACMLPAGAAGFLAKPFQPRALIRKFEELLAPRRAPNGQLDSAAIAPASAP
jgi:two-component system cell cycle sensor histidine kinase/response regulator CckA